MITEILYNGRCPICSAEIAHYRARAAATEADLRFTDLNTAPLADWGISADQATRRLHARHDGRIVSGFAAFLLIWQACRAGAGWRAWWRCRGCASWWAGL